MFGKAYFSKFEFADEMNISDMVARFCSSGEDSEASSEEEGQETQTTANRGRLGVPVALDLSKVHTSEDVEAGKVDGTKAILDNQLLVARQLNTLMTLVLKNAKNSANSTGFDPQILRSLTVKKCKEWYEERILAGGVDAVLNMAPKERDGWIISTLLPKLGLDQLQAGHTRDVKVSSS